LASAALKSPPTTLANMMKSFLSMNNSDIIPLLLEWSGALAEEIDNPLLPFKKRTEMKTLMKSMEAELLMKIKEVILGNFTMNEKQRAFSCLSKWIQFGVPLSLTLSQHSSSPSILEILFNALKMEDFFEGAVEVLTHLLQKPVSFMSTKESLQNRLCFEQQGDSEVIRLIAAKVLETRAVYESSLKEGNEKKCRGIAELLLAIAEGHISLFSTPNQQSEALLDFLLLCTSHPYLRISELTLDFWCLLETHLHSNSSLVVCLTVLSLSTN
jgi:hypothetical protein